ncbi:unnamed protein product [Euphydryas editha]|uniref:Uncharacterized protein n=1 Tax=Euphydryas editha TaxID=104508 RepID=A0AAU9TMT7_EUPED|nr:unnamed protein product [Euphydryas editha]
MVAKLMFTLIERKLVNMLLSTLQHTVLPATCWQQLNFVAKQMLTMKWGFIMSVLMVNEYDANTPARVLLFNLVKWKKDLLRFDKSISFYHCGNGDDGGDELKFNDYEDANFVARSSASVYLRNPKVTASSNI